MIAVGFKRRFFKGQDQSLEVFHARVPQSGTKMPDNAVKLATFIALDRLPYPLSQGRRIQPCTRCDLVDVGNSIAKNLGHVALGVIHTIVHRRSKFQKLPKQLECLGRCRRRDLENDHVGLRVQILDQRLAPSPAHIGLCAPDRRQPFAHVRGQFRWTQIVTKLQPQPSLHVGAARADLYQQIGQPVRTKVRKVRFVQGLFRHNSLVALATPVEKMPDRPRPDTGTLLQGDYHCPAGQFGNLLHCADDVAGLATYLGFSQHGNQGRTQ